MEAQMLFDSYQKKGKEIVKSEIGMKTRICHSFVLYLHD